MFLSTPVTEISGIGPRISRQLKKLDIKNVEDLLLYFPFRYDDFTVSKKIVDLQPGEVANITATIELIQNKKSPRRRMYLTESLVSDGSEILRVLWFNQPFLTRNLKPGDEISLSGRVTEDFGGLIMTSPQYEILRRSSSSVGLGIHTQGLVPIYHLTGLLTQKGLRSAIAKIIIFVSKLEDWLPEKIVKDFSLISLAQAVKQIHFPENQELLNKAKERLGFDELLLMQLRAQKQRQNFSILKNTEISFNETATKNFVKNLPFDLTDDQKKAAWEIIRDLGASKPMLRLLQGDVGSGKTIVACLAILNTALAKKQSALMAPTEILALQHFETLNKFFIKEDFNIALLTNSYQMVFRKAKVEELSKKQLLGEIKNGSVDIIIGTHALIQKNVDFKDLALAIVDEQHRFGVEQRKLITQKVKRGTAPHVLSMTATPIPRSLALAIYGDLDISIIKQLPVGRQKVDTKILTEKDRSEAYELLEKEFTKGNQAFVICPLIDESDILGFKSVKTEFEKLDKDIFKHRKIGLLHGKLKAQEKERVMKDFQEKKLDAVVATSIVEIGVDIPHATIMMIEDADRFGLAQLHQYRGRVGRRDQKAYCLLMTQTLEDKINHRLQAMMKFSDGFSLAQADLQFRGPGEVYGLAQKGFPELKMANFYDTELIKKSREVAINLLSSDPNLDNLPKIKKELGDWEERAHLE